jgi:hypothetical protein
MRLARRVGALVVLVVASGYVSNVVTRPLCERDLMRAAVHDMGAGESLPVPVFVLADTAARSERALRGLGVSTVPCRADAADVAFNCFPWAGVKSSIVTPFVVTVEWEYVAFPTSGHGNRTTFLALFGFRLCLREQGMWVA